MNDKPIELKRPYGIEPRNWNKFSVSTKLACIEAIQNNKPIISEQTTNLGLSLTYAELSDIRYVDNLLQMLQFPR